MAVLGASLLRQRKEIGGQTILHPLNRRYEDTLVTTRQRLWVKSQYCSFSVKSQMVAAPLTAWAPAKLVRNVLPGWGGGDAHSWGTASGGVSPCEAATVCGYSRNVKWQPHGAHQRTICFAPATALGEKAPERGWVRRTSRPFPVKDKLRCVTPCVSAARCISQQIASCASTHP